MPLLAGTLVLSYLFYSRNDSSREHEHEVFSEVTVSPGAVMQIELPDRSHVWLNGGSRLRYPVAFRGETRAVELTGEGYFDVYTDAARPFEVTAPSGLKVIARGTEFNLKAYGDEDRDEVVLQEGLVDVSYEKYSTTMKPGEMLSLARREHRIKRTVVRTDEKTAWKDGLLIFRDTPLEEVMEQLSRRYNADITLHNPDKKSSPVVRRATFSSETLAQILDYLQLIAPIEWSRTEAEQNADGGIRRQQIRVTVK